MLMIQWFGNKPATPVVQPQAAGRIIAAQVEKALSAPQKLVETTIAVAREVEPVPPAEPLAKPARTAAVRRSTTIASAAPVRRASMPAAAVPVASKVAVEKSKAPVKYAIVHNAGIEPVLVAVTPQDAAQPATPAAKNPTQGFAVISGMSSGPVYIEVVPYQDSVHVPQLANVYEPQPPEPKRTAIIAGLED